MFYKYIQFYKLFFLFSYILQSKHAKGTKERKRSHDLIEILKIYCTSSHLYHVFAFRKQKKICIPRLHVKEVQVLVSKCLNGVTHNSVMNSESSDHVIDVASWLFGQHMFTHFNSPMSAIRGLVLFVCVCA